MTTEPIVETADAESKLPPAETFRILIMDSVERTDMLKRACKDVGYSVVGAHSIDEAFAFLNGADHADVIICAAYLENESLFDFLNRLRKNPTHRGTMFMTLALEPGPLGVRINASTEKAGKAMGASIFINMPEFDAEMLVAEVRKLLPEKPKLLDGIEFSTIK